MAIMRFTLTNPETREFVAERWCFRGSVDGWIYAGHSGQMDDLAKMVIPALGTDNFYALY
ncbi:MAG: hypothetical protein ACOYYS_14480 [Chloroflexota bacterium]